MLQSSSIPFLRRLRPRLIMSHVMLVLGAILLATPIALLQVRNQFVTQTFFQLDSVITLKENAINRWLIDSSFLLDLLANEIESESERLSLITAGSRTPDEQLQLNTFLTNRNNSQRGMTDETASIFEVFFVYNLQGRVVGSSHPAYFNRIVNLQPYFAPSLEADHIEPPYYEVGTGELTILMTHPLRDDTGNVVAVLAGRINITTLQEIMLERTGLGETGETYLVSQENNYLLTPSRFADVPLTHAYRSTGIDAALNGQVGSGQYDDYRGVPVFGAYRAFPLLNAGLLAEIDEQEAQAIFNQTALLIVIVAVLAAAIAGLVGWIAASAVARPIAQLSTVATQISTGDYSKRVSLRERSEIGVLANAFNQMTDQLTLSIESLDQRVRELDEANDALRIATAKAREAARVKGEFLANVSHELRTPLNAIIGFSDMLLMGMSGELNPKQRHKLERLRENGTRLLNLINDILDITRIEARRIEIVNKPFDPRALATRLSAQMSVLAEKASLEFETHIGDELPSVLLGDEKQIEQIVVNLLSNAFKFTERGSVTLSMESLPEQNLWQIQVADTGIGIPPHAINLIFEEFRQVDGTSTRAYKGSGLGLAITRNLVRIMNGTIEVESELEHGSAFTVKLPLLLPETAAAAKPVSNSPVLESVPS